MSTIANNDHYRLSYPACEGGIHDPSIDTITKSDYQTASQCSTPEGSTYHRSRSDIPPEGTFRRIALWLPRLFGIFFEPGNSSSSSMDQSTTLLNPPESHHPSAKNVASNDTPFLLTPNAAHSGPKVVCDLPSPPEGSIHRPSSPFVLPRLFDTSAELGDSSPCPRCGMNRSIILNPAAESHQLPVKHAVSDDTSSLLTPDSLAIGHAAYSGFKAAPDPHSTPEGNVHRLESSSPLALLRLRDISAESGGSSPRLRSSMMSANLLNPPDSRQPPVKSAVSDDMPSLLSQEILAIGDAALSEFEVLRELYPREDSELQNDQSPFSSFSSEALETYFAAAVDLKNALQLRQSVVAVDIGELLEMLLPKLNLYMQDGCVLETAFAEMMLIEEESLKKDLNLDFFNLEFSRYRLPAHKPSVLERHTSLFADFQYRLEDKDGAQQATHRFMADPFSLQENRLLFNSQR